MYKNNLLIQNKESMTSNQVKEEIKKMIKYDINHLNSLSNKSGISLMTINFWWNAIKN